MPPRRPPVRSVHSARRRPPPKKRRRKKSPLFSGLEKVILMLCAVLVCCIIYSTVQLVKGIALQFDILSVGGDNHHVIVIDPGHGGIDRGAEYYAVESEETENGVFERPLSLKGQRHIFLYKCRYSKLKAVIDSCGCWDLRISSLDERWPCLLVYCAKSKDIWRNAFKRISKLEKGSFLRRKISDSLQSVDLQKLESLVEYYGQKYARSPAHPLLETCACRCARSRLRRRRIPRWGSAGSKRTWTRCTTSSCSTTSFRTTSWSLLPRLTSPPPPPPPTEVRVGGRTPR